MAIYFLLAIGVSRIFFLTIILGGYYKNVAIGNTAKIEKEESGRGIITDRNGKQLALNIEIGGRTVRHYPY